MELKLNNGNYVNQETNPDVWTAPDLNMLPHFIVCGVMKSGTTTLHRILEQHPKVFFAEDELHFFNIDDILEHPNFQRYYKGQWFTQDISKNPKAAWNWYASHFNEANSNQIKGEDTTSYFSSKRAVDRIALQKRKIKIIILLRNPVDRTYSEYWHRVRAGRAIYDFERTLLYEPDMLFRRSMYLEQLEKFFQKIPREQIKVYLFEDFVKDSERFIREVCEFINIDFTDLPNDVFASHRNKTRIPMFFQLQLHFNRMLRFRDNWRYLKFLPFHKEKYGRVSFLFARLVKKINKIINPMVEKKPPPMSPETRRYLTGFFKRELNGLNELVGRDLLSVWFPEDKDNRADL